MTKARELSELGSYLNVSGGVASVNNITVSSNLEINVVVANGSVGTAGQMLTSNGSGVYWLSPQIGDITNVIAGTGLAGGGSSGEVTVSLATSGVVANTYGNSSSIPVITVDTYGRLTNVSTAAAAVVTNFTYTGANNTFSISTGDGSTFTANITAANATLAGVVTVLDSVTNTSVLIAASANSVKNAYDRAIDANTRAASAQTAAISAYSNAVSVASADATNKAANAYSNAVSYAATVAGTAYSNAVSTAAADATSKANNAYTTAVAAAASDATSKANNAYTTAVSAASTDATNKAANAYSNATTFASNASNISTGTLAEPRLPYRMNQDVRTTDSVTFANGSFTGTVSVGGDLIITGNVESTNVQSLAVSDPLIKLGVNNPADTSWGGFTFHYSGSGNTTNHAGLVRNPSTKEFLLMSTYGDEVNVANNNSINVADPSFSYANLQLNTLTAQNATVSGNVGIGTSSPGAKLHVQGTSYFNSDMFTYANGGIFFSGNNSYNVGLYSRSADLVFQANGSERMRITSAGDVGIGTSAPAGYGKLAVIGHIASSTDGATVLTMRANAGGTNLGSYNATGSYLAFQTNASGSGEVERMRITTAGDVGIGTSSPDGILHVRGNIIRLDKTGTAEPTIRFRSANDSYSSEWGVGHRSSSNDFAIRWFDGSSTWSERFSITTAGNVGIGTGSPAGKLAVASSSSNGTTISAWSSSHSIFGPNVGSTTGAALGLGYNTATDTAEIVSIAPGVAWKNLWISAATTDLNTISGRVQTNQSFRAPIFYDSDNTGFYLNPNDVSNVYILQATNYLSTPTYYSQGDFNLLNTAGNGYNQVISRQSGDNWIVYGGGSVRAPVFYDSADSGYFFDLKDQFNNTYTKSLGGFYVDANGHYFRSTASALWAEINSDYLYHYSDIRSGLFYDYDNTFYYLDPASTSYLRNTYVDRYFQRATGTPTNNLGDPTVTEMALFDQQFTNKTEFFPPANVIFETSTDGTTWTTFSVSDAQKKIFVGGDDYSSISIPYNTPYFRVRFVNDGNYVFLNALYTYWASQGHTTKVQIYTKDFGSSTWVQYTNSNEQVSSWPGHLYLPFQTIAYHPGTYVDQVAVVFQPTWNPTWAANNIALYKMQIWGGYPAGKRTIYSVNADREVTFPAAVKAPIFYDSNDTAYYVNPNSTSRIANTLLGGNEVYIYEGATNALNIRTGASGSYKYFGFDASGRFTVSNGGIFSGGYLDIQYNSGNEYAGMGIRNNYGSASLQATGFIDFINENGFQKASLFGVIATDGHGYLQFMSTAPGVSRSADSRTTTAYAYHNQWSFQTSAGIATNILYDRDNTAYYLDPNSSTVIENLAIKGAVYSTVDSASYVDAAIEIRERNLGGSQADSYNNAPRLGFHWGGRVAMQLALDSSTVLNVMNGDCTGWTAVRAGDVYGNAYYDRNNTSYYLNPNGSSYVSGEFNIQQSGTSGLKVTSTTGTQALWVRAGYDTDGSATPAVSATNIQFQSSGNSGGTFTFVTGNTKALTIAGDYAQGAGSLRAPIFYDSDNTGYYLDPHQTSNIVGLTVTNTISGYISGAKFSNDSESKDDITTRTESGFWQSSSGTTAEGWPVNSNDWQHLLSVTHNNDANYFAMQLGSTFYQQGLFYRATNGSGSTAWSRVALYDNAYSSNLRATVFYDNDNTAYYADPNSTSRLSSILVGGNESLIYENATNYLSVRVGASGSYKYFRFDTNGYLYTQNGGVIAEAGDIRAPIFYDQNDTTYYIDPASGALLNSVSIRTGGLKLDRAYNDNAIWFAAGTDSNHAVWNDYNGGPGTRGSAGSGFDGIKWNAYRGIHIRGGLSGQYNIIVAQNSSGATNDHTVELYALNVKQFETESGYALATNQMRSPIYYISSDTTQRWNGEALVLRGQAPTVYFRDTDANSAMIHVNSNLFYILRGGNDTESWTTAVNSAWPLQINLTNNDAQFGANLTALNNMYAQLYYDRDNTGYYIDPASTSILYNMNLINLRCRFDRSWDNYPGIAVLNTTDQGPQADFRIHGLSGANGGDYNVRLLVDGEVTSLTNVNAGSAMYAPIYYDSNDSGYYYNGAGYSTSYRMYIIEKFYARGNTGVDECCGSDATISVGGSATRPPSISFHYSGVMQGNMQANQTGWRKVYFYDDQGSGLGVHATGQIASNADVIAYYSDKRLKKDLVRVVDHWNVINNLNGYRFTWNEKSGEIPGFQDKVGKREVGLIAQDVQAVYPEAIAMRTEGPEDDPYMTIKHDRFTAVFIEALKDLRRELDEVKEENKKLREMINGQ